MGHDNDDTQTLNVNVTLNIKQDAPLDIKQLLTQLLTAVTHNQITLQEIKMTQQEMDALLQDLDAKTTKVGANLQIVADVDQKISDEIDAFIAGAPAGTVITDAQVTALQGLATKAQATSDASDQIVAFLQAVAAKGQPVVPPPPPPPPVG